MIERFKLSIIRPVFVFLFLVSGLVAGMAQAEVTPWQEIPEGRARLLTTGLADTDATGLGVEVDLNEGWKIY